jgi:hypothetical protein
MDSILDPSMAVSNFSIPRPVKLLENRIEGGIILIKFGTITNNKEYRGLVAIQESIDHGVLE